MSSIVVAGMLGSRRPPVAQRHERIRLLDARPNDAARAVIFEAAPDSLTPLASSAEASVSPASRDRPGRRA